MDDNIPFAENLAEILRDEGAEVAISSSGADALARIAKQRFDVMVTDMRMPGMNGAELVNQVRKVDPGLAAVVVTAFTGSDDLAYAENAGLVATLPKPVPIAQLLRLLELAHREGIVAIVEDDQSLSENLAEVLRGHGFSPVTAASVPETERMGPVQPFVALVDLKVPGGPVGEGVRRVNARFPGVPLLVMTAFDDVTSPVEARRTFIKPFNTAVLLQAIEDIYATHVAPS